MIDNYPSASAAIVFSELESSLTGSPPKPGISGAGTGVNCQSRAAMFHREQFKIAAPVARAESHHVATIGFSGTGRRDTCVTWPIWDGWLGRDAVAALLAQKELQDARGTGRSELKLCGVHAIYQSHRITLGKFRNFTPPTAL